MRVLMPLPSEDFDPTESAVPWRVLVDAGHDVQFATPDGRPGSADMRMVDGHGLGPWKPILRAAERARALYAEMVRSPAFQTPSTWDEVEPDSFDALLLPGGHAPGMRPYLESKTLQTLTSQLMARNAPIAAICHGVVLLSRARSEDGDSVLRGRRATALLASQELAAYAMTALWLGPYYRTYPETVQSEVVRALGASGRFEQGPPALLRDSPTNTARGFVVRDGNLLTARWPGDAYRFSNELVAMLSTP